MANRLTLEVFRSDGSFKWRQPLHVLERRGTMVVGEWREGDEVIEGSEKLIQPATAQIVLWTDRWYNVIHNSVPMYDRVWYCNVATPAILEGDTLRYTDMDLDIAVTTDGEVQVLDEDEFATNQARFGYHESVTHSARQGLASALDLIRRRKFPFTDADLTTLYRPSHA